MAKSPKAKAPTRDPIRLDDALSAFLQDHPDATLDDITKHVTTLRERDELVADDMDWIAQVERRGLEEGLRRRLRGMKTASIRTFVTAMDDAGHHTWVRLADALKRQDTEELHRIENHAWSAITEACGQIVSHRAVLLKIGRPLEAVDARIRTLLEERLAEADANTASTSNDEDAKDGTED